MCADNNVSGRAVKTSHVGGAAKTQQDAYFALDGNFMFYVYILLDPRKPVLQPFYVGKGSGTRRYCTVGHKLNSKFKQNVINRIRACGMEPIVYIYASTNSENEAYDIEKEQIARFGRRDIGTGILTNLSDGGSGGAFGTKRSDETKKLMSMKKKQPVVQFSFDGLMIKQWDSIIDAAEKLGINRTSIADSANNRRNLLSAGGFYWRLVGSEDIVDSKLITADNINKKRLLRPRGIRVSQIDVGDSTITTWPSIAEAARNTRIGEATILRCVNDGSEYKGFRWILTP